MALDFSAILGVISQVLLPGRFLLPSIFGIKRLISEQEHGLGAIRMMRHYWQHLSCRGEIGSTTRQAGLYTLHLPASFGNRWQPNSDTQPLRQHQRPVGHEPTSTVTANQITCFTTRARNKRPCGI